MNEKKMLRLKGRNLALLEYGIAAIVQIKLTLFF